MHMELVCKISRSCKCPVWCSLVYYGWTEGQNAYYPVQKNLWEESKEFVVKNLV